MAVFFLNQARFVSPLVGTVTATHPLCSRLSLLSVPLQVTTGSDAYSFGVLMWSLYTGEQPYACKSGLLLSNPLFPHFPKAGHAAHPQYTCLAERCLRMDPHERPSFTEITESLLDFFNRESVATGPPKPAPPTLDIEVPSSPSQPASTAHSHNTPGLSEPPPAMSAPAPAAGGDDSIIFSSSRVGYIDSRHLLASCLLSAGFSPDAN